MLSKLQQKNNNNNDHEAEKTFKDNNIFRALMQKMKTLEMNNAIIEMYTLQVVII